MRIDKVVFSTSEAFSVHWNAISEVYATRLGIHPVCLLYGNRSGLGLSDKHGEVIEVPVIPDIPLLIQITWGKFQWTTTEPDTTWMIGDIDLYPLQRNWFVERIADVADNNYVHLDADGITQLSGTPYLWAGRELHAGNLIDCGHPTNVPAHYHVAKGRVFKDALEQHRSLEDELRHIVRCGEFNGTRAFREEDPIEQHNLWCAEELRSTRALRRSVISKLVEFTGFSLKNGLDKTTGDRVCPSGTGYLYDSDRLRAGSYVDVHAARPFAASQAATQSLLKMAHMID